MGDLTASTRGVALVVSKKFACTPVGTPSPYWVFARLYGSSLSGPILVGTIYVPNREGRNSHAAFAWWVRPGGAYNHHGPKSS